MKIRRLIILLFVLLSLNRADAQLNKPYFYQRGRDLNIEGRFREAIESLNILVRNQKNDYEGYFLRGVAKYNLDDLSGALADFSTAIEIKENFTAAFQYRAITHSRMGQYTAALEDFDRALKIRPSMAGLYYSRGITYFLNLQFAKSIVDFDQFLRIEPLSPDGYINRGTSYLHMKDTVSAIKDYNHAIRVNPYYAEGYMRRGLIHIMQANYMEAIKDLDKTIQISPDASYAYFYRALAFTNLDKIMLALEDFDKSISLDSTNSVTYFNRAILRSQIGDYNRAIEDYTKVAQSNPNNVLVFFNRAGVNAQIGDYNQAIYDYSRAIELYPDFANAYLYRASLKRMLGDMRGSQNDTRIAEMKIAEYRSKLNDSTFSIYADTSKRFNQIMSLDVNFGNEDFSRVMGDARTELPLLPLFRIGIAKNAANNGSEFKSTTYQNQRLSGFIASIHAANVELTNMENTISIDSIEMIDNKINDSLETWDRILVKSITQSLLSQYISALNYMNFAINERPNEPFAYINRGVTQATMIEFIASLDGDYQNITIDTDPATRLKKTTKRNYDYSAAIDDLKRASELMPELPHIYYNLGNLMCQSGDMPAAIAYYTKAIELYPYFAEAYYNRGLVQIYVKDYKTGCLDISKAGELGIIKAYDIVKKYCVK